MTPDYEKAATKAVEILIKHNIKSFPISPLPMLKTMPNVLVMGFGEIGSLPEDVRSEEFRCFAHHLLTPRALIHTVQATGIRFTVEVLGNLTGCYERCLHSMRQLPPVHIDPELNLTLRARFMPYVKNFFECQRILSLEDGSALADFGKYMEGYEE